MHHHSSSKLSLIHTSAKSQLQTRKLFKTRTLRSLQLKIKQSQIRSQTCSDSS